MATAGIQQREPGGMLNVRTSEPSAGPFREIQFAQQLKVLRQGPGGQEGRNSKVLVKHSDFRIVLTALRAHSYIHEHDVAGCISMQILEGHIRMHIPGRTFDLKSGDLVVLEKVVPRDVEALTDSAYLVTVASHDA